MIEKYHLGGECTHTACVPSKALIRAARIAQEARGAGAYGLRVPTVEVDFPAVMGRVREVVSSFAGSDSGHGLEAKGITVYRGSPTFEAYDTIRLEADDGTVEFLNGTRFVIATGSRPAIPPIEGLDQAGYLDNTTIWGLEALPASLVVLGAGPVGMEFGQALARLGTRVTVIQRNDRVLPREDPEVSERLRELLSAEGMEFITGAEVDRVGQDGAEKVVRYRDGQGNDKEHEVRASQLLVATGRLANIDGLNLEALGIPVDPSRGIEVDAYLRTRAPNVYAIGDVLGHHQWTHAAEREAAVVFQNAVLRLPKKIDYRAMPWATFTDPEVASVGTSEAAAREAELDARTFRAEFDQSDRARIDGQPHGLAKVVVDRSGKVLGATVLGVEATSILQEFVVAMENGLTLADLGKTVHPYPTYPGLARSLANQYLATRLEKGTVQKALRLDLWLHAPGRQGNENHAPDASGQEPQEFGSGLTRRVRPRPVSARPVGRSGRRR